MNFHLFSQFKRGGIMKTDNMNQKMRKKKLGQLIGLASIVMVISFLTVGCNGSSHDNDDDHFLDRLSGLQAGTFVDSPVQGLDYYSASSSGVTAEDGHFMYQEGEMMTFAIGDVILGEAMAREVMTPMDFIDESERPFDVTHPVVTNMGRFLQSLDVDGNPENGIMISQDVKDEVSGRMIDFHQSIMDFESDPDTEAFFATMNGLNMPHNGLMWGLEAVENVQAHMNDHLGEYVSKYMDGNTMGTGSGNNMSGQAGDDMGTGMGDDTTGTDIGNNMGGQSEDGTGFGMSDDSSLGDGGSMTDNTMGTGSGNNMGSQAGGDMGTSMGNGDFIQMDDDTMGAGSGNTMGGRM
jgi:hypothetical protein